MSNPESRNHIDILGLVLAMSEFKRLGGDESHYDKGQQLLRRFRDSFQEMVGSFLTPMAESNLPGLQTLETKLERATRGSIEDQSEGVAECAFDVCRYWKRHQNDLRAEYSDMKTREAYLHLVNACLEDQLDMNSMLSYPKASKARLIPAWIKKAVELTAQANEVEVAIADMRDVESLAEEIKSIDARLRAGEMSDAEQLEYLQMREAKYDELLDMTRNMPNRDSALAVASNVLNTNTAFQTETGRKQGLTPEQEEAMMVRGKAIIAAGAGSGKTRVLASKIAYLINELGVKPDEIIATSFSRDSANELKHRAKKYTGGDKVDSGKYIGSTTHSIGLRLCSESNYFNGKQGPVQNMEDWVEYAVKQVSLYHPNGGGDVEPKSFFDFSKARASVTPVPAPVSDQSDQASMSPEEAQYKQLMRQVVERLVYRSSWEQSQGSEQGGRVFNMLKGLIDGSTVERQPDGGFRGTAMPIEHPAWNDPNLKTYLNNLIYNEGYGQWLQGIETPAGFQRFASKNVYVNPPKSRRKNPTTNKWEDAPVEPVGMWFNLGVEEDEVITKDVGVKDYKKYIDNKISSMITPSEAWQTARGGVDEIYCAVYGAYMYFKDQNKMYDYSDMILGGAKLMIESPRLLQQMQNTYKHIFVDEAQDLNPLQHAFFGLIAGHINPETLKPYEDNRMTADTYCFIGDDKQAIYEFRGAQPEMFINMSDTYHEEGQFKTTLLRTNFRSGRNIVSAANKLIEKNTKQIPMVCNPSPHKGEGAIAHRGGFASLESPGSEEIAREMREILDAEGWNSDDFKFGIACRTNKELKGYAFDLLVEGIPYYSKRNLLDSASMMGAVHWMAFASSNPTYQLKAVYEAHDAIGFMLDRVFRDKLEQLTRGQNPMEVLLSGRITNSFYTGNQEWRNKNVKAYIDAIRSVRDFQGSTQDLLEFVLNDIKGTGTRANPGKTYMEKAGLRLSNAEMNELSEEAGEGGEVTDEDKEAYVSSGVNLIRRVFETRTCDEGVEFFFELLAKGKEMTKDTGSTDRVYLGTSHSWKGLECEQLYVPMNDGTFPHSKSTSEDELASERRLAYVALTRGQDKVTVLSSEPREVGKTIKGGPSRFIEEACIQTELQNQIDNMGEGEAPARTASIQDLKDFLARTAHWESVDDLNWDDEV